MRVKGEVKYSLGFDFTFDARQRWSQMRQRLSKALFKTLVTLTSPSTHVKGEAKGVVAVTTHLTLVKDEFKYEHYNLTTLLNGVRCQSLQQISN